MGAAGAGRSQLHLVAKPRVAGDVAAQVGAAGVEQELGVGEGRAVAAAHDQGAGAADGGGAGGGVLAVDEVRVDVSLLQRKPATVRPPGPSPVAVMTSGGLPTM